MQEFFIYALPLVSSLAGVVLGYSQMTSSSGLFRLFVYPLIGFGIGKLIKTFLIYPPIASRREGQTAVDSSQRSAATRSRTVDELVGQEINVSHINPVPCVVEGEIIGRGVPGLMWSHDLVLRDSTGFMRLRYRQPFRAFEFLFGLFKAESVIGREARVHGWYRRAPSPYVEISFVELREDHRVLRCYYRWGSYALGLAAVGAGLAVLALL